MSDDAVVSFFDLLYRDNKISLETLILRGNSNLKLNAGLALEKLAAEHGLKRVDLYGTSVPKSLIEKIKIKCDQNAQCDKSETLQLRKDLKLIEMSLMNSL